MKKILIPILLCVACISGCGGSSSKVELPYSSEEIKGKVCSEINSELTELGFTNIELLSIKDLETEENLADTIEKVEINGETKFEKNQKFDLSVPIKITYHEYVEETFPYLSEDLKGNSYKKVVPLLNATKFFNIRDVIILDEENDNVYDDEVEYIKIQGTNKYTSSEKYSIDTEIVVYHSMIEECMPVTSSEVKGQAYNDVMQLFENTKFTNVTSEAINPVDEITEDERLIESISVNGSKDYTSEETYPINAEIVLHYKIIEDTMPITSEEAKGKTCEEVEKLFDKTKFKDIIMESANPSEEIAKNERVVENITINGNEDYSSKETYPINANVVINYSIVEKKMPITSDKAKEKNCGEVKKIFKNVGFKNVKIKNVDSFEDIPAEERVVESITIDGSTGYTSEETYPINSKIVINYKAKKYSVTFKLKCEDVGGWFNPEYDILVFVGENELGTLEYGSTGKFTAELPKGTHNLILKSVNDENISETRKIKVEGKRTLRYDVTCGSSEVEVKYYKTLKVPYTNKTAKGKKINTIKTAFKKAGYKNIEKIELNDLGAKKLSKKGTVSKIEISGNKKFTKNGQYYSDSEVKIYYHSPKLIEIPISSSDAKGENRKIVVKKFKKAGFTNVISKKHTGNYSNTARNNQVAYVEIAGDDYFYKDDEIRLNSKVRVYYYDIDYKSVTVSSMMNFLDKNAYNAQEYYEDRYVSATGWVKNIDSDGRTFELMPSSSDWEFFGVECKITDNNQKKNIAKLSKGKKVTVKGRITYVSDYDYSLDIHKIIIH